ncbi:hypothetical protein WDU94_011182 [Cyamophila willieti]
MKPSFVPDNMMSRKVIVCLVLAFSIQLKAESQWSCRNPECYCIVDRTTTEDTWKCYPQKPSPRNSGAEEKVFLLLENGAIYNEPVKNSSIYHEPVSNSQIGRSDPEEDSLIIRFDKYHKSLVIDCSAFSIANISDLNSSLYDSLPKLDFVNLKLMKSIYCPFPDESFQSFLRILNVTNVAELRIEHSASNISLSSLYFDGLPFLEQIYLQGNPGLKELPADLFKGTPDLIFLTLRNNKIAQLDIGVFQHLKKLDFLDLGNNEISELDPRIFRNLTSLTGLNIDNNPLINLKPALFTNVPNLRTLDITQININALESGVFDDLVKLQTLHANKNKFQTFPADLFSKTKELQSIRLFYLESLVKLPSGLFSNLPKLNKVDIRVTSIEELPSDLFWNSTKLKSLTLSGHRKLKTITSGLFRDCKVLEKLDLTNNGFESLPEHVFKFLEKLTTLDLSGNRLEKITETMFESNILQKLNLAHNKLRYISFTPFDFLKSLKIIDLSYNKLDFEYGGTSSPLNSCVELQTINLSHNRISRMYDDWIITFVRLEKLDLTWNNFTILSDVFSSMYSNGSTIDLSNNQISIVELHKIEFLTELEGPLDLEALAVEKKFPRKENEIILSENPLACNCSNYDFFRFLQGKMSTEVYKKIKFDTSNVKCQDSSYPNRLLNSVHPRELRCPIEHCPSPCKCTFSPYNNQMTVNCASANLKEMPQKLPTTTPYGFNNKTKIELILRQNSIQELPQNVSEYARFVTDLDLSYNDVSDGEDFIRRLPRLEKLNLSGNKLKSLSKEFVNLSKKSNISSMFLSGNQWNCDCSTTELSSFILSNTIVRDSNEITCNEKPLIGMSPQDFCPSLSPYFIAGIALGILGVISFLVAIRYKFDYEINVWMLANNWIFCWVSEDDIDHDKEYDVFVSYTGPDFKFVVETLIKYLEEVYNYRVCHHERDFIGGNLIIDEIHEKISKSRRTIIVLTEDFVKSNWGMHEFRTAYAQAIKDKCPRVIMVIYKNVPSEDSMEEEMKSYLKTHTYIKYRGPNDNWFWDQLKYAIRGRSAKTVTNDVAMTKYKINHNGIENKQDTTVLINPDEKETQMGHFAGQIMQKG